MVGWTAFTVVGDVSNASRCLCKTIILVHFICQGYYHNCIGRHTPKTRCQSGQSPTPKGRRGRSEAVLSALVAPPALALVLAHRHRPRHPAPRPGSSVVDGFPSLHISYTSTAALASCRPGSLSLLRRFCGQPPPSYSPRATTAMIRQPSSPSRCLWCCKVAWIRSPSALIVPASSP